MAANNERLTRLTLIEKLKDNKSDANWDEFANIYRPYIYVLANKMSINHEDCEDIIQAVFVKVWSNLEKFKHGGRNGQFRRWLTMITRNTVLNLIKRHKRESTKRSLAEQEVPGGYLKCIELPEVEKLAEREWAIHISNLAWNAIESDLSDTLKKVFEMSLDGVPRAEIAERLKLPVNTISVYKRRVTARLNKEMHRLDTKFS